MENLNFARQSLPTEANRSHVLVFTSGKGGVGKTCVTTNVAAALAQRGARVCIFDADTGLANINILLGLRPEHTLEQVLNGEKTIQDIVIKTSQGISVVPGASGVAELANMSADKVKRLCEALVELEAEYDYFLIDTAAGVADSVLQFIDAAPYTFLLITPEPTSLTDGFSLLKLLNARNYNGRLRVVVNMAADYPNATETYRRFAAAVDKYLELKVEYGGFVARDDTVLQSVTRQIPVVDLAGNAPASRCLFALADNMLKYIGNSETEIGLADYWKNFLQESPADQSAESENAEALVPDSRLAVIDRSAVPLPIDALSRQLLAAIKTESADRDVLESFVADFTSAFVDQFGNFPHIFRQLLFRWLEAENYEAPRLLELMGTLESLYLTRYQQPMHSLEDSAARLVAQCRGSEADLRDLIKQLRTACRQSFQVDPVDARQEVLDSIGKYDFSEEDFQQLLDSLGQAFQSRFKRPYQGQSDLLLESTAESLAALADDEKILQEQIDSLTGSFQQLNARREALRAAIISGQQGAMPFNSKASVEY